jgi:hypothetical protein
MKDPADRDPTQSQLILERLKATPGTWVPMPELHRVSGAYAVHSRVSELRSDGHDIRVRVQGSRPRKSFYRLDAMRAQSPNDKAQA